MTIDAENNFPAPGYPSQKSVCLLALEPFLEFPRANKPLACFGLSPACKVVLLKGYSQGVSQLRTVRCSCPRRVEFHVPR